MNKRFVLLLMILGLLAQPLSAERFVPAIKKYRPDLNYERAHALSSHVVQTAKKHQLDPKILMGLIAHETDVRNLRSQICRNRRTGRIVSVRYCKQKPEKYRQEVSCGYTQIKPRTFYKVMGYWPEGRTRIQECQTLILQWRTAVEASARLLDRLEQKNGHLGAVGAYNCPGCRNGNRWYVYEVLSEVKVIRNHMK